MPTNEEHAVTLEAVWPQRLLARLLPKGLGRTFTVNVGMLSFANAANAVVSFLQGILVARWLGPEWFGVAALVMSYPSLVYTFCDARSARGSIKYLSEFHAQGDRERALAVCKVGYGLDLVIAAVAFAVVLLSAPWAARTIVHRPEAAGLIIVCGISFLPDVLVGTSSAVLLTLGRFSAVAWIGVLSAMLDALLVLSLLLAGWGVAGVVWGHAVAMLITGLVYWLVAHRVIRWTWGASWLRSDWRVLKGRLREIFSFHGYNDLHVLAGMVPKQLDLVLLGYFRNPLEVGYYRLAKSLASVAGYLEDPLQAVAYPALARLSTSSDQQPLLRKTREMALRVGLPLGCLGAAAILIMPFLIGPLIGASFLPAVFPTQLFLLGAAGRLASFWFRPFFLSTGHVRFLFLLSAARALVCVPLFILGAALWGYQGLAVARFVTGALKNAVAAIKVRAIAKKAAP